MHKGNINPTNEIVEKCKCYILPSEVLEDILREGNDKQKKAALHNLQLSAAIRTARVALAKMPRQITSLSMQAALNRTVHTMNHNCNQWDLPGNPILYEGQDPSSHDEDTKKCYQYSKEMFDFLKENFGRISTDDNGYPLVMSVHFCEDYDNAFWQGLSWAFGDGGGGFFKGGRMTDRSVVYHEMAHGLTQHTSNFEYRRQSGGLNESTSDVFSAMCEQWVNNQKFEEASWLIGDGTIEDGIGKALRSMEDPGNRSKTHMYDRQIKHLQDYNNSLGPHTTSGIANKAFYLTCKNIGGYSWDKPGKIWYKALLTDNPKPFCTFKEFAEDTVFWAKTLYGENERGIVENAWKEVGVEVEAEGITLANAFHINTKYSV